MLGQENPTKLFILLVRDCCAKYSCYEWSSMLFLKSLTLLHAGTYETDARRPKKENGRSIKFAQSPSLFWNKSNKQFDYNMPLQKKLSVNEDSSNNTCSYSMC